MKGSHCGEHCWQEGKYMKNFQIGKSGIEVPFLGMGTWAILSLIHISEPTRP